MQRQYVADVTPQEAWETLAGEPGAALVDVRTQAEWSFVGLPDLSGVAAPLLCIEWQMFPGGQANGQFVELLDDALKAKGCGRDAPVFFICRSGARSASAAAAMRAAGYTRCFNVGEGFEGDRDENGRRGTVAGWKVAGLPWTQS